jgi:hypothetical protein
MYFLSGKPRYFYSGVDTAGLNVEELEDDKL